MQLKEQNLPSFMFSVKSLAWLNHKTALIERDLKAHSLNSNPILYVRAAIHQTRLLITAANLALNIFFASLFQCLHSFWVKNFLLLSNLKLHPF